MRPRPRRFRRIAAITPGFSGADLANLVNEAALIATRRERRQVTMDDFTRAMERIVAGIEKHSRILTPKERESSPITRWAMRLSPRACRASIRCLRFHHPARHRRAWLHYAAPDRGPLPAGRARARQSHGRAHGRARRRGDHFRAISRPARRTILTAPPTSRARW